MTTHVARDPDLLSGIRVLVIDDRTLYRECLTKVLCSRGVAATAPESSWEISSVITRSDANKSHVVLLNMATHGSSALLQKMCLSQPHVRVIVLGISEQDADAIVGCAEAGAAGYHLRTESLDDLLDLISKVAAGESLCSPKVSAILLARLSALAAQRCSVQRGPALTAREMQILRMLELGLANRDIAAQLCIAVHTVKNHVHNVLTKLGVDSREQAAALARTVVMTADGISDQIEIQSLIQTEIRS